MAENSALVKQIIRNCAPTLANLKTGSLFSCSLCSGCDINAEIRRLNHLLTRKGLRIIPIKTGKKCVLIYLYRLSSLSRDFSGTLTQEILKRQGYLQTAPDLCIRHLVQRLKAKESFPHEIGLFLGYPPEDVSGFIENHAKNYVFCGKWKVYGNPEKAKKLFDQYRICETCYLRSYENGRSLDELAVAG